MKAGGSCSLISVGLTWRPVYKCVQTSALWLLVPMQVQTVIKVLIQHYILGLQALALNLFTVLKAMCQKYFFRRLVFQRALSHTCIHSLFSRSSSIPALLAIPIKISLLLSIC